MRPFRVVEPPLVGDKDDELRWMSQLSLLIPERIVFQESTSGVEVKNVATLSLVINECVIIQSNVIGLGSKGVYYSLYAGAVLKSGVATLLTGTVYKRAQESLVTADANIVVSGVNVITQITGVSSEDMEWAGEMQIVARVVI